MGQHRDVFEASMTFPLARMPLRQLFRSFAGAVVSAAVPFAVDARVCRVVSGVERLPVVELYTSEGCSSCPPADRQLAEIGQGRFGPVAPLALHVNFWDQLGWRDPYAQAAFTERQRRLVEANQSRNLYTPHVFVSGREVRDRSQIAAAMGRVAARAASWSVALEAQPAGSGTVPAGWQISAKASPVTGSEGTAPGSGRNGAAVDLVLMVTESALSSKVRAGENAGEVLKHAHVVRHWEAAQGDRAQGAQVSTRLGFEPAQLAKGLEVVAFVQDRRNAEILQAVRMSDCLRR